MMAATPITKNMASYAYDVCHPRELTRVATVRFLGSTGFLRSRTAQLTLESLSKSRARKSGCAISSVEARVIELRFVKV